MTSDILQAIAALSVNGECRATLQTIADRAGVCERTVRRALKSLERSGLVTRDGGQGRVATFTTPDIQTKKRDLSEVGRRVYDDPADKTPGAEYTPIGDIGAAVRDRVKWYVAKGRAVPASLSARLLELEAGR